MAVRPLFKASTVHGVRIQSLNITGGELRIVLEFPRGNDTREMVGLVQDHLSNATLVSQRTRQRSGEHGIPESVLEDLTEKQQEAIEKAYTTGYFNWPRTSNAGEIAERLGVSSATFTQHLRTAERKIFERIFEEHSADESDTDLVAPPDE
jgi:predicted DNA binding protein